MPRVPSHIILRGKTYHYRRRYPRDIIRSHRFSGQPVYQVSLGTSDHHEARRLAVLEDKKFELACQTARDQETLTLGSVPTANVTTAYLTKLSDIYYHQFVDQELSLLRLAKRGGVAEDEAERRWSRLAPSFALKANGEYLDRARDEEKHARFLEREFRDETDNFVERHAHELGAAPGSDTFLDIQDAIVSAKLRAFNAIRDMKAGELHPKDYNPSIKSDLPNARKYTWTLKTLSADYLSKSKDGASWRDKVEKAVEAFEQCVGADIPISEIDQTKVKDFVRMMLACPANAKQRFPTLTIADAIKANEAADKAFPTISPNSVKTNYLAPIRKVLAYATDDLAAIKENPFARAKVPGAKKSAKRAMFDVDELNRLFELPLFSGCKSDHYRLEPGNYKVNDHAYWVPILMLFTGARVSELAQLAVSDIKLEASLPYIDILTEYDPNDPEDRPYVVSEKTENSRRRIPIHPDLLCLGFDKYVRDAKAAGWERLFPSWKLSKNEKQLYSSAPWVRKFNDKLVPAITKRHPKPTLYSLRHTFKTQMAVSKVPPQYQDKILGHADRGMDARYLGSIPLPELAEEIAKVKYPGLALPNSPPTSV